MDISHLDLLEIDARNCCCSEVGDEFLSLGFFFDNEVLSLGQ